MAKKENDNSIVIRYDTKLLSNDIAEKINTVFNQLYSVASERMKKSILEKQLDITIVIEAVKGNGYIEYFKDTKGEINSCLAIHKKVNKQTYENSVEQQVAIDVIEIVKILDQLRWNAHKSVYQTTEEDILQLTDIKKKDLILDADIVEICELIKEARKILKNIHGAPYELKNYFKQPLFIKYKEHILFVYLYERMIRTIHMLYKTRKIILKAFDLYKIENVEKESIYYPMYTHLMTFRLDNKPKINTWFYIRKAMLLIPVYIALASGTILFPVVAIVSSLGILWMDYLINLYPEKYFTRCMVMKTILYTTLMLAAFMPFNPFYQLL